MWSPRVGGRKSSHRASGKRKGADWWERRHDSYTLRKQAMRAFGKEIRRLQKRETPEPFE